VEILKVVSTFSSLAIVIAISFTTLKCLVGGFSGEGVYKVFLVRLG